MRTETDESELEARLCVAFDEMIPKMLGAVSDVQVSVDTDARWDIGVDADSDVDAAELEQLLPFSPDRRSRARVLAAVLAVAATIVGVIAIANRSPEPPAASPPAPTEQSTTPTATSPADDAWYGLLRPIVPDRFAYLAVVHRTDTDASFVAIDTASGKSIEIMVTADALDPVATDVDETGTWAETPQGWIVMSHSGVRADVSCNIGVRGRDFPGPPNYCEMDSVSPISKDELRAIATAAVTAPLIEAAAGAQLRETAADGIEAVIASALPEQQLIADVYWGPQDRVWEFGSDLAGLPDTAVRVVTGVFSPPSTRTPDPLMTGGIIGLYEDAAAFWMLDPTGVAIRVSTTDPTPESLERLIGLVNTVFAAATSSTPIPGAAASSVVPTTTGSAIPTPEPMSADTVIFPDDSVGVDETTVGAGVQTYVVQPGDLPSAVAERFGVPLADLIATNGLTLEDNHVTNWPPPGRTLTIPTR